MKRKTCLVVAFSLVSLAASFAFAAHHTPEDRGMAHFNNPQFADGVKSCSTCHPGGSGLKDSGSKTEFFIMGSRQSSLAEAVNVCIVKANKGTAIDEISVEMQEIVSYIKSLGQKPVPGYGK